MPQVVIENPILNSPFDEPSRHFRFTDEDISNEIVEARRVSSYFVPIPRAKSRTKSSELLAGVNAFLLWYAKDIEKVKYRELLAERDPFENPSERYICVETPEGDVIDLSFAQKQARSPYQRGMGERFIVCFKDLSDDDK